MKYFTWKFIVVFVLIPGLLRIYGLLYCWKWNQAAHFFFCLWQEEFLNNYKIWVFHQKKKKRKIETIKRNTHTCMKQKFPDIRYHFHNQSGMIWWWSPLSISLPLPPSPPSLPLASVGLRQRGHVAIQRPAERATPKRQHSTARLRETGWGWWKAHQAGPRVLKLMSSFHCGLPLAFWASVV